MTVVTPKFGMGASVLRREDQAFIKGEGRYTDDISPAGLCSDRVNYVGDAVAFVVADSRALAQDAAEMIEVDYDSEDAASGTAIALDEGTPPPSTTNALGIKGAGEAGTIGATPAALNTVTDALWRAYGIRHIEMPATPARIWAAIQEASPA
ncbi:carbon-monoxide dehydrogenase (acceptor) [Mesorhizobium amorphae CCNWGS0123]|uniref:Carbon-monoxide dehydrogenase (Acceptor) n=1 Tax=Mesorhizobium amorphae CCNWGS0123 TaxID=1082933 RepID=G6Y357_9HYPH|nr:hypothetical protein A6B35_12685 [Mesorhizobium amorphae CCNWGS0123]EHH13851.1 carbon-monoxide dehydrogenase (acceptor) [Mesorhizobium amorphae CCNWGS0123]